LKPYFAKEDYFKNHRLLIDNEFDEYVYLVSKGVIGCIKSVNRIPNLKEKLSGIDEHYAGRTHVVLENFRRGDIFGVYSALKHQKNNYTAVVLSDKASVYKIAKAHILLYFGGSAGTLPNALKGVDVTQQPSLKEKIDFLVRSTSEIAELTRFQFLNYKESDGASAKIMVDETQITNYLKDAWKEVENLGSKVQNFKTNLFNKPVKPEIVPSAVLNKIKDVELKDHSKVMGFGTNRVVSNKLNTTNLNASQVKGMNMLKSICDVKKKPVEEKKDGEEKKEERKPNRMKNLMSMDDDRTLVGTAKESKMISENQNE